MFNNIPSQLIVNNGSTSSLNYQNYNTSYIPKSNSNPQSVTSSSSYTNLNNFNQTTNAEGYTGTNNIMQNKPYISSGTTNSTYTQGFYQTNQGSQSNLNNYTKNYATTGSNSSLNSFTLQKTQSFPPPNYSNMYGQDQNKSTAPSNNYSTYQPTYYNNTNTYMSPTSTNSGATTPVKTNTSYNYSNTQTGNTTTTTTTGYTATPNNTATTAATGYTTTSNNAATTAATGYTTNSNNTATTAATGYTTTSNNTATTGTGYSNTQTGAATTTTTGYSSYTTGQVNTTTNANTNTSVSGTGYSSTNTGYSTSQNLNGSYSSLNTLNPSYATTNANTSTTGTTNTSSLPPKDGSSNQTTSFTNYNNGSSSQINSYTSNGNTSNPVLTGLNNESTSQRAPSIRSNTPGASSVNNLTLDSTVNPAGTTPYKNISPTSLGNSSLAKSTTSLNEPVSASSTNSAANPAYSSLYYKNKNSQSFYANPATSNSSPCLNSMVSNYTSSTNDDTSIKNIYNNSVRPKHGHIKSNSVANPGPAFQNSFYSNNNGNVADNTGSTGSTTNKNDKTVSSLYYQEDNTGKFRSPTAPPSSDNGSKLSPSSTVSNINRPPSVPPSYGSYNYGKSTTPTATTTTTTTTTASTANTTTAWNSSTTSNIPYSSFNSTTTTYPTVTTSNPYQTSTSATGTTPYQPSTTPNTTPYQSSTAPSTTPYQSSIVPSTTPYQSSTATSTTPYQPSTTPSTTPYQPSTTPNPTPYQTSTTPNPAPYQTSTTPNPPPYQSSTTPSTTPYQTSTTPNPYQPSTTPNPYQPSTTPNPYQPSTTPNPYQPSSTPNPYQPSSTPNPYQPSSTPNPYQTSTTPTPYYGSSVDGASSQNFYNFDNQSQGEIHSCDPIVMHQNLSPIVSFGFGGKMIVMFPKDLSGTSYGGNTIGPNSIHIKSISSVIYPNVIEACKEQEGPILGQKKSKKQILDMLAKKINKAKSKDSHYNSYTSLNATDSEEVLILKIIQLYIENDGVLYGQNSKPEAIQSLRNLLMNNDSTSVSTTHSIINGPSVNSSEIENIKNCLLQGDRPGACKIAVNNKLWAHALIIASYINKETYKDVVSSFIKSELQGENESQRSSFQSIKVLYSLFAGMGKDAIIETPSTSIIPNQPISSVIPTTTVAPSATSTTNTSDVIGKWKEILSMILSNRTPNDVTAIVSLGDTLLNSGKLFAAHLCYLFSPSSISGLNGKNTKAVLLGVDHLKHKRFYKDRNAFETTEFLEYMYYMANKNLSTMPHFQAYKLDYANWLADIGLVNMAFNYAQSIMQIIKSGTNNINNANNNNNNNAVVSTSIYYNQTLFENLKEFTSRCQGHLSGTKNAPKDGWFSKITKFDTFLEAFDHGLNKFIGSTEDLTNTNSSQTSVSSKPVAMMAPSGYNPSTNTVKNSSSYQSLNQAYYKNSYSTENLGSNQVSRKSSFSKDNNNNNNNQKGVFSLIGNLFTKSSAANTTNNSSANSLNQDEANKNGYYDSITKQWVNTTSQSNDNDITAPPPAASDFYGQGGYGSSGMMNGNSTSTGTLSNGVIPQFGSMGTNGLSNPRRNNRTKYNDPTLSMAYSNTTTTNQGKNELKIKYNILKLI